MTLKINLFFFPFKYSWLLAQGVRTGVGGRQEVQAATKAKHYRIASLSVVCMRLSYSGFFTQEQLAFSFSLRKKKKPSFKVPYCPLMINGIIQREFICRYIHVKPYCVFFNMDHSFFKELCPFPWIITSKLC